MPTSSTPRRADDDFRRFRQKMMMPDFDASSTTNAARAFMISASRKQVSPDFTGRASSQRRLLQRDSAFAIFACSRGRL